MVKEDKLSIISIRTDNFIDTLYYESIEGAMDFAKDQVEMGYGVLIKFEFVDCSEYENKLASMDLQDGSIYILGDYKV